MALSPEPSYGCERSAPLTAEPCTGNDAFSFWQLPREWRAGLEPAIAASRIRNEWYLFERYSPHTLRNRPIALNTYYKVKRFIPHKLRTECQSLLARSRRSKFPSWPIETALIDYWGEWLEQSLKALGVSDTWHIAFWPEAKSCAIVLTHDIESPYGLEQAERLADLEEKYGFRSAWNVPLDQFPVDWKRLERLRARGFELGAHGLAHDGKLFASLSSFTRLSALLERLAREKGLRGFRSPSTLRRAEWIDKMDFDYDCSFPDTDPFEPQPGGCCSIFPYFLGRMVELPYTVAQDHTLFNLLRRDALPVWNAKADWIASLGGMILTLVHPDYTCGEQARLDAYEALLKRLGSIESAWRALPSEAAAWWRRRSQLGLSVIDGRPTIAGPDATGAVAKRLADEPLARRTPLKPREFHSNGSARRQVAPAPKAGKSSQVLIIAYSNYFNDARIKRHAEALVSRGAAVDVICLASEQKGEPNGVNVLELDQAHYRGASRLAYVSAYVGFFARATALAARLMMKKHYDLAITCSMPDAVVLCATGPKLLGAKVVLDVHDTMPELYREKFGDQRGAIGERFLLLEERVSAWFADRVLAVHEPHRLRLERAGVPAAKISVVMNSPDPLIFRRSNGGLRDENLSGDGRFVLLCHGTITRRMGLDTAIEAIAILRDKLPAIRLRVVGDGDYLGQAKALVERLELGSRVDFHGIVPVERLPMMLETAQLGLVPNRESAAAHLMLPVKLLDYTALGIPVIASRLRTVEHYFGDCAVRYFTPGDPGELADAIEELYGDPERRSSLAHHAQVALSKISWPAQRGRLLEALDPLLSSEGET